MLRMYGLITYHGTPKTMQHEGFNPYKDGLYPLKMRLVIKRKQWPGEQEEMAW